MYPRFSKTLADGIAVKRPGEATYELLSRYLDALVLVNEDEIKQAIMQLLEHHQILVEGAGAVAVAAFMHGKIEKSYRQVALITSGKFGSEYAL